MLCRWQPTCPWFNLCCLTLLNTRLTVLPILPLPRKLEPTIPFDPVLHDLRETLLFLIIGMTLSLKRWVKVQLCELRVGMVTTVFALQFVSMQLETQTGTVPLAKGPMVQEFAVTLSICPALVTCLCLECPPVR